MTPGSRAVVGGNQQQQLPGQPQQQGAVPEAIQRIQNGSTGHVSYQHAQVGGAPQPLPGNPSSGLQQRVQYPCPGQLQQNGRAPVGGNQSGLPGQPGRSRF